MTVDTKRVKNRRVLRFQSLEDIYRDAEKLAAGPHRQLGNWSLGRVCKHLAMTMDLSIDGGAKPAPWFVRIVARPARKYFLTKGFSPGFQLRPVWAKHLLPPDEVSTEEGLAALRAGIDRLESTEHREPHIAVGKLTRAEWDQLHLRHGELHLSFITPEA